MIKVEVEHKKQIVIPPIPTKEDPFYRGISFWARVLRMLDDKDRQMAENSGYGDVGIIIKYQKGKIYRISWVSDVSDMDLTEKAGGNNEVISLLKKEDYKNKEAVDR